MSRLYILLKLNSAPMGAIILALLCFEELHVAGDGAAAGFVQVFLHGTQGDDFERRGDACVSVREIGSLIGGLGPAGEDVVIVCDLVQTSLQRGPEAVQAFQRGAGALHGFPVARGVFRFALQEIVFVKPGLLPELEVEHVLPAFEFGAEGGRVDLLDPVELEGAFLPLEDVGAQGFLDGGGFFVLTACREDDEQGEKQDAGGMFHLGVAG